ncbi:MAG TPA: hypothetical protein VN372_05410 [Methanospirillum sp.]|nr:hypothetical protein [Methanospirillum sp.]
MTQIVKPELHVDIRIDPRTMRHYYNDQLVVVHCHHYSTLYTQLAVDAGETKLLQDVSEDMFFSVLSDYFQKNPVSELEDRIEIAIQHYGAMGLGSLEIKYLGQDSADFILRRTHVDKGWLRKWGKNDKPVNYIGAGCIAGLLSAVHNKPVGTFDVRQTKALVMGDEFSEMKAVKR